jgi:hypothetical protein
MQTNLMKQGDKWAIEVIGGLEDEPFVKTFGSLEDAEKWRRQVGAGELEAPVLTPKKATKVAKVAKVAKAVKTAKSRVGSLKT